MFNRKRFIGMSILAVGTAVVVMSVSLLAFVRSGRGREWIAGTVSEAFSASEGSGSEGYSIRIGAMGVPGLTGVEVHDISISDGKGGGLISLPDTRIRYNPLRLLRGASAGAVSGIELVKPEISLKRDDAGRWNLELLMGAGPGKGGFLLGADADIRIIHGVLHVEGIPGVPERKGTVEGRVRLRKGRISSPGLNGYFDMGNVYLAGSYDLEGKAFKGDVKITEADLKEVIPILPAALRKHIMPTGTAEAVGTVEGGTSSPRATFEIAGRNMMITPGTPGARPIGGEAWLRGSYGDGTLVLEKGEGEFAGGAIHATGRYPLDGSDWAFDVSAEKADLSLVADSLGYDGSVRGRAKGGFRVQGDSGRWSVIGGVDSARADLMGVRADNVSVGFEYLPEGLHISRGAFTVGEAKGSVSGWATGGKGMNLSYRADGLELAQLALIDSRLELSGVGDIDGRLMGGDGSGITAKGRAKVRDLSYAKLDSDVIEGDYSYGSKGLSLDNLVARRGRAVYTGYLDILGMGGKNKEQHLNGRFAVAGETIGSLASVVKNDIARLLTGIGGDKALDGRIKVNGPLSSPQFSVYTRLPWGLGSQTTLAMKWMDGHLKLVGGSLGPAV